MAIRRDKPALADRNDRIEFTVHRNMYDPARVIPLTDLYGNLDLFLRKDLLYHYSGSISALNWIALCQHPKYHHIELVELVDGSLPEIVQSLRVHVSNRTSFSLVSLGAGDGEIDIRILRHFEDAFNIPCYYCLDFSFELLRYAVFRVSAANVLKQSFRIKAVCGNFAETDGLLEHEEGARLFSLTGFTLGNYNEAHLLGKIAHMMTERDFLLVDAHLHGVKNPPEGDPASKQEVLPLLDCYAPEIQNRFVFGPIEVATIASPSDVTFDYKISREMTAVPNALNLTICCKNLRTKMRYTGETIERSILDLASTTFYRYSDLREWFIAHNFQCVWEKQAGSIALFLLKPSESPDSLNLV